MPTGFSNAARLFQVFLGRESATHRLNVSHIFRYFSSLPCTSAISVSSSFRGLRLIFLSSHSSLVSHFDAYTFLSFSIRSLRHFCLPCNAFDLRCLRCRFCSLFHPLVIPLPFDTVRPPNPPLFSIDISLLFFARFSTRAVVRPTGR